MGMPERRGEVEASTGIEPVYTDLQSAASPLRQLAIGVSVVSMERCYCKVYACASGKRAKRAEERVGLA